MTDPFDTVREALEASESARIGIGEREALTALASIEERLEVAERHLGKMPSPERIATAHSRLPAEWFKSGLAAKANAGAGHFAYYQAPEACYLCTLIGLWEAAERERDAIKGWHDDWKKVAEAAERERDQALHAEEVAEQYREKAEARVVELEELLASLKVCRP